MECIPEEIDGGIKPGHHSSRLPDEPCHHFERSGHRGKRTVGML